MDKQPKPYSQSQKVRFALFDLWNLKIGAGKMPFEEFYNQRMEALEKSIRDEIAALNPQS